MVAALLAVTNVIEKFSVPGSQFSVKSNILRVYGSRRNGPRSPTILTGGIMGRSYRELIAWQKAMKFVIQVYEVTQRFPSEERYGLTNQLRRASVSVPSNIAEGQARFSQKEFHHFLSEARGSLVEIETQFLIARDLKYLQPSKADVLLAAADELGRVLNGLIASIKIRAA
jgi:four helix bundle protein